MSEKESETKVIVGGKPITLEELKKKYSAITIAGTPGNVRVMDVLATTDKPLDRRDIANKTQMTSGYTRDILKKLMKQELVLEFRMGGRILYYLLTEKGFSFYKKLKPETK